MVKCVISGCRSDSSFVKNSIAFHRLPKNEFSLQWEQFLLFNEKKPHSKIPKICSLHFEKNYIFMKKSNKNGEYKLQLKANAIPTIIFIENTIPTARQAEPMTSTATTSENRMCRICLTDQNLISIFEDIELYRMIEICTDVKMSPNDGFPGTICNGCIEKVVISYKLRIQTKQTDEILRDILKINNPAEDSELETSRDEGIFVDSEIGESSESLLPKPEPIEEAISKVQNSFHAVSEPQNQITEIKSEAEETATLLSTETKNSIEHSDIKLELDGHKEPEPSVLPTDEVEELPAQAESADIKLENEEVITPNVEKTSKSAPKTAKSKKRKSTAQKPRPLPVKEIRVFCNICGKTNLRNGHSLSQHIKQKHSSQTYPCDLCPKVYVSSIRLRTHKRHNHELKVNFKCDQCPRSYLNRKSLQIHKLEVHYEGPLKYTCAICDRRFKHPAAAEYHVKMHRYNKTDRPQKRPVDSTRPKCTACKIDNFDSRTIYRAHVKEHANNYQCGECQKVFATDLKLRAHQKLTHRKEKSSCDKCEFRTKYPQVMKRHVKKHAQN